MMGIINKQWVNLMNIMEKITHKKIYILEKISDL